MVVIIIFIIDNKANSRIIYLQRQNTNMAPPSRRAGGRRSNSTTESAIETPTQVIAGTAGTLPFFSETSPSDGSNSGMQLRLEAASTSGSSSLGSRMTSDTNRNQIERLNARVKELQDTILQKSKKSGKNKTRTGKKDLTPTDLLSIREINSYIGTRLRPYVKIMPRGWHRWKNNPTSVCQRIMMNVNAPAGNERRDYWNWIIKDAANDKLCALRANFKAACRVQFTGKLILGYVHLVFCLLTMWFVLVYRGP